MLQNYSERFIFKHKTMSRFLIALSKLQTHIPHAQRRPWEMKCFAEATKAYPWIETCQDSGTCFPTLAKLHSGGWKDLHREESSWVDCNWQKAWWTNRNSTIIFSCKTRLMLCNFQLLAFKSLVENYCFEIVESAKKGHGASEEKQTLHMPSCWHASRARWKDGVVGTNSWMRVGRWRRESVMARKSSGVSRTAVVMRTR